MAAKNEDLHGNAPDKSELALLLIDVINDLDFPGSDKLVQNALPMARKIAALKVRAKQAKVPVIFANDNFGRWRSDFKAQVDHCLKDKCRGRSIVELLQPEHDDYFVLKPKHSGFFSTSLDILLTYLGTKTLILTGMAANICVLFTANDAYLRDLRLIVPSDCEAPAPRPQHERLLLGDTPYDVAAGVQASVAVVALRCGGWRDEDLAGAIAIYDDVADICDHYAESPFHRGAAT